MYDAVIRDLTASAPLRGLIGAIIAFSLFCLAIVVLRLTGTAAVRRMMRTLALFLLRRGLFRGGLESERRKIDLLRIVTGLILLTRTAYTSLFVLGGDASLPVQVVCVIELALAASLLVGFLTPLTAFVLLLANVIVMDAALSTYTLGSDVLAMMLLVFAFAPSGTSLSLDAAIVRRDLPGARLVNAIYAAVGKPTVLRLVISKWAVLLSYYLLCVYSVLLHLSERDWLTGNAAIYLLTSSYMSRYYEFFRYLFAHSEFAVVAARLAMMGMVGWYIYLLPFILIGGWFRRFAFLWTILFFLFSLLILQLSWLAYYEFVMLALLFWDRAFLGRTRRVDVLYDDRCNLCDRTVRTLRVLDIFQVLIFRPLSRNEQLLSRFGLKKEEALRDLYGIDRRTGKIYGGYEFYVAIVKRLFLLTWLVPVALIGRYTGLGSSVYRFVADRRLRWFGVCALPRDYNKERAGMPAMAKQGALSRLWLAAFFCVHSTLAVIFILGLPYSALTLPGPVQLVVHAWAIAPINVFNHEDLKMSTHWFTLETVKRDGSRVLVPITAPDGSRLAWHSFDPVYFGNTLLWRRSKVGLGAVCYTKSDDSTIEQEIQWAARRSSDDVDGYRIAYYYQPLPELRETPPYVRYLSPGEVCVVSATPRGQQLTIKAISADEARSL